MLLRLQGKCGIGASVSICPLTGDAGGQATTVCGITCKDASHLHSTTCPSRNSFNLPVGSWVEQTSGSEPHSSPLHTAEGASGDSSRLPLRAGSSADASGLTSHQCLALASGKLPMHDQVARVFLAEQQASVPQAVTLGFMQLTAWRSRKARQPRQNRGWTPVAQGLCIAFI